MKTQKDYDRANVPSRFRITAWRRPQRGTLPFAGLPSALRYAVRAAVRSLDGACRRKAPGFTEARQDRAEGPEQEPDLPRLKPDWNPANVRRGGRE